MAKRISFSMPSKFSSMRDDLTEQGFTVVSLPDGSFTVTMDAGDISQSKWKEVAALLEQEGIKISFL